LDAVGLVQPIDQFPEAGVFGYRAAPRRDGGQHPVLMGAFLLKALN